VRANILAALGSCEREPRKTGKPSCSCSSKDAKWREATQKHTALLAYLHKNQGRLVSYRQLVLILGHKSARKPQQHLPRQYMLWISKTLAAHKALCTLAVAYRVGYVLCGHK
jgi:DNA-binding response OmpR family regulator